MNEGKRFDEELFEVTLLHRPPFSVSFIPKHNKYITDLDVKQQNEVVIVQTSPQVQISNHFISSVCFCSFFMSESSEQQTQSAVCVLIRLFVFAG